jgi:3-dehydroquinate synthase
MTDASRIVVHGDQPYDVIIGRDVLGELIGLMGDAVQRVAVISVSAVRVTADRLRTELMTRGYEVHAIEVPDGEDAKTIQVAAYCWSALGDAALTRSDAIVGVGGGATTDLAGFVAATWLRGVRVVHVPTTVAGMNDAAIGGKTAINTEAGKNLVGAFHPPGGVLSDLETLRTLPRPDYVAGMAEVVKHGFIADPRILDLIEADVAGALHVDGPYTREIFERSIRVKAEVVSADLRETGLREILNYGHTLGHAIEKVERYRWRHGDAVAVGMVFAAELARVTGNLDVETVRRHRSVLTGLGLPTSYEATAWSQLLDTMRVDKKARGDRLRFVILTGLAKPVILNAPGHEALDAAYAATTAAAHRFHDHEGIPGP